MVLTPLTMIYGGVENKTNARSHSNIGLFKTAIEKEWNKMSQEFIWRHTNRFEGVLIQKLEKKNSDHK